MKGDFSAVKWFSLVELLVVISIIGVLLSLLFPALQRSKTQAYNLACAGLRRQIELAERMYEEDWHQASDSMQSLVQTRYLNTTKPPKCPCNGEFVWDVKGKRDKNPKLGC